jgi:flagellar M-ring protein FliF
LGSLLQTLSKLGPARLAAIGIVAVLVLGFFGYVASRLAAPNLALLYADLDPKDASQIATKLDAQAIPYEIRGDGSMIYVPADQVPRLRLAMAEAGIPHGTSIGYEIFDKSESLGTTNFQEGINEMRALEGELERTISQIQTVDGARVHLVLPKRELFSREHQEPSASIVIKVRGADRFGRGQVNAILNLVASAVPGLKPSRISIVDQAGNLLARGNGDPNDPSSASSAVEDQRVSFETRIAQSVEDLINRTLGFGRARVDVNADMDFDRVTTSTENYNPDGQVVRSTQTVSDTQENAEGAAAANPVTVQTNLPEGQATQPVGANRSNSKNARNEETTNYEISKTVVTNTREGGAVKRLSVAVLVDGTYVPNDKGEKTYQARTPEELANLTKLVQSAIGFDEKRGDRVEVVNMPFAAPDESLGASPPVLLGMDMKELVRIGEYAALCLLALLVAVLFVRPLMIRALDIARESVVAGQRLAEGAMPMGALAGPGGIAGALPGPNGRAALGGSGDGDDEPRDLEQMINLQQVEGRVRASSMKKIGEIVEKHPDEAVAIIRSWMYQGP